MILIDSNVWSISLRRRHRDRNAREQSIFFEWHRLVYTGSAAIIGPIRQEVLSGTHSPRQAGSLKDQLKVIPMLPLDDSIWDLAAEYFNTCRAGGVAPGNFDMTICAAAFIHNAPIFTTDPDFPLYAKRLPIDLYKF